MSSDEEREEKELDLTSPEVVTKYKSAAEIINSTYIYVHTHTHTRTQKILIFDVVYLILALYWLRYCEIFAEALQLVVSECKPKAKIVDVCEIGDSFIREWAFIFIFFQILYWDIVIVLSFILLCL